MLSITLFIGFGLYHLTKFETVDEHFWKYKRIVAYWDGIQKGFTKDEWKKTRINDKPGVTLALVTLPGRLIERHPDFHRNRNKVITKNDLYTVYDATRTERINLSLRLPLLLFNGLVMLPLLFFLIKSASRSQTIATISIFGIATSPILVGISQIINPDTLLWSFGTAAFFAFVASINTLTRTKLSTKKLLYHSLGVGLLTGFALLSKYTANLLFVFYIAILVLYALTKTGSAAKTISTTLFMRRGLALFGMSTIVSIVTFAIFMPAVLQKYKYFAYGTFNSPTLAPIIVPFGLIIAALLVDTFFLRAKILSSCTKYHKPFVKITLRILAATWISLFTVACANAWLGAPWMPLENVKERISYDKQLTFPMFANDSTPVALAKEISIQSQQFIFSIPPLVVLIVLIWLGMIFFKESKKHVALIIITLSIPFVFFFGGLFANIYTNARYMILLYPLWSMLIAIAVVDLAQSMSQIKRIQKRLIILGGAIIIGSGVFALWKTKPFYFNYQSSLLPQKYVLKDSWGYGSYEAARYLNSLPNAKNLTIWSDRSAVCQFITGRCVRDYKINLDNVHPDYIVLSRRGAIRHQFIWDEKSTTTPSHPSGDYYRAPIFTNPVWEIHINNRHNNFIKIIKMQDSQ